MGSGVPLVAAIQVEANVNAIEMCSAHCVLAMNAITRKKQVFPAFNRQVVGIVNIKDGQILNS